ncbi:RAMP superfamily CRISPR-associated protein [Thermoleptolyngbya sichuanensis XZ-Cy5]|uniref:RAMP superfamily CRISPR-associated protein n=1 Tax=Thermoleptolyngbya sichuanensis TaxID=2885951 RepID=UPI00240CF7C2|nr:RAMP superfamily CRISPR-associated protein [Thermoleptolyngbya sichuanensis]MDG2616072.1 RAMP superfamily CRISPR-associated protein [Thermoleptolyngbya sichuanensis XZ-Cy5]
MTQTELSSSQRIKRNQREIIRRVIVRGCLRLESPTCLGSGDADSPTDMPLLRDSISQRALLTGSSIAGALRNYLRDYEHDYGAGEASNDLATDLFGAMRRDDDGDQSPLIAYDAISSTVPTLELRDGVKIDSKTGTASDKAKYDLEVLAAGTEFPLQFELLIDRQADQPKLLQGLAIALQGLENGEITLGMKKRRGFGRCQVSQWQVWDFDLTDPVQSRQWVEYDHWTEGFLPEPPVKQSSILDALKVSLDELQDQRDRLILQATFAINGSLLIRSGQASIGRAPDVVQLKSYRNGELKPVLSGTSLAGVLRHRAERIVNTLVDSGGSANSLISDLFGDVNERAKTAKSSRLIVQEAEINNTHDLVQNRIAIDRFTGGALQGALFDEQPIFGGEFTMCIELRQPKNYEIGLLLLLLKDLWTGDLPVGGESSIGRGRLQGRSAKICHCHQGQRQEWTIDQVDQKLHVSDAQSLEEFVLALVNHITGRNAA